MPEKIKIFDVKIDNLTLKETTKKVLDLAKGTTQNHLCTVNPEILLKTLNDNSYKKILLNTTINTADGAGILWAANYLKNPNIFNWIFSLIKFGFNKKSVLKERVTGTDLVREVVQKAEKEHRIFFLGAAPQVAERAKINLYNKYHNESISGCFSGSYKDKDFEEIAKKINESQANILFVAFGAPAQDIWIAKNLHKLTNIKVAVGIGGAFDFHANKITRAPHWMQRNGLEWLYRLYKEPKRIMRIINATIVFPIKLLFV